MSNSSAEKSRVHSSWISRLSAPEAAAALGAHPPILLGFPDGKLGDFLADRTLLFRLTARIAEELARLRPDAHPLGPGCGVPSSSDRLG